MSAERIVWCGADLSDDGVYRYTLRRRWASPEEPSVCWIMLNPSTADAVVDDPTIRRCIGFSEGWGFGSLTVVNLFGLRATDPKALLTAPHPVGPENDEAITTAVRGAWVTVAAWGVHGTLRERGYAVTNLVTERLGRDLMCLGTTKDGHPRHPLYVKGDTAPTMYRSADLVPAAPPEGTEPP